MDKIMEFEGNNPLKLLLMGHFVRVMQNIKKKPDYKQSLRQRFINLLSYRLILVNNVTQFPIPTQPDRDSDNLPYYELILDLHKSVEKKNKPLEKDFVLVKLALEDILNGETPSITKSTKSKSSPAVKTTSVVLRGAKSLPKTIRVTRISGNAWVTVKPVESHELVEMLPNTTFDDKKQYFVKVSEYNTKTKKEDSAVVEYVNNEILTNEHDQDSKYTLKCLGMFNVHYITELSVTLTYLSGKNVPTYIAMVYEFVDGITLDRVKFKEREREPIVGQLKDFLSFLSRVNMTHNDLHTKNIMYEKDSNVFKMIDYGRSEFNYSDNTQFQHYLKDYEFLNYKSYDKMRQVEDDRQWCALNGEDIDKYGFMYNIMGVACNVYTIIHTYVDRGTTAKFATNPIIRIGDKWKEYLTRISNFHYPKIIYTNDPINALLKILEPGLRMFALLHNVKEPPRPRKILSKIRTAATSIVKKDTSFMIRDIKTYKYSDKTPSEDFHDHFQALPYKLYDLNVVAKCTTTQKNYRDCDTSYHILKNIYEDTRGYSTLLGFTELDVKNIKAEFDLIKELIDENIRSSPPSRQTGGRTSTAVPYSEIPGYSDIKQVKNKARSSSGRKQTILTAEYVDALILQVFSGSMAEKFQKGSEMKLRGRGRGRGRGRF
jgi:hypothetical protein